MTQTADIPHWEGNAPWPTNAKWPKRALEAERIGDRTIRPVTDETMAPISDDPGMLLPVPEA